MGNQSQSDGPPPDDVPFAVRVRPAASGYWWVVDLGGEVLSQWPSEFAATDAGRVNARRFELPLIVEDGYTRRVEHPRLNDDE